METSFIFRRALQAILPVTLLLSACGKKEDVPAPTPVPDQGKINMFHSAASANLGLKFLVNEAEVANLTYGQNSGYKNVNVGNSTIRVNVASSGSAVGTQAVAVEKNKNYSLFAYSSSATQLTPLLVTDDLTAPSSGKVKIRFVNLAQGAATPLKLSTTAASAVDIAGTETAFGMASGFVEVLPGSYNVAVTSGATSTIVYNVGEGNGTSTSATGTAANKNFEANKIYTVVYRGITGQTVADELKPRATIFQNN